MKKVTIFVGMVEVGGIKEFCLYDSKQANIVKGNFRNLVRKVVSRLGKNYKKKTTLVPPPPVKIEGKTYTFSALDQHFTNRLNMLVPALLRPHP